MKRKEEFIFKIVGAMSTAIIFSLFIWAVFAFYQLTSLRFFDPEYLGPHWGEWGIQPPLELIAGISILSAIIIFILFFRTEMGKPTGGKINISDVFDRHKEVFKAIRGGRYSLKKVILLLLVISILTSLFGGIAQISGLLLAQSKYGYLDAYTIIRESVGGGSIPDLIPTLIIGFFLLIIISIVLGFAYLFTLAFFFYWFSRLVGARIPYLHLYSLLIYLSVIPLAFLIISTIVNLVSYLALENISTLNMFIFPNLGYVIFYIACMFGIKDISDISLKWSFLVTSPFLILIFVIIYLTCFFTYELPQRIMEITFYQLGL